MEITINVEERFSAAFLNFLQTLSYVKIQKKINDSSNGVGKALEQSYFDAYAASAVEDLAITRAYEPIDFDYID